jgi:hypothetical protein
MIEEPIAEVGIRADGGLFVRPESSDFAYIYRAGMEVSWDAENRRLFGPKPREQTYAKWFAQILAAAAGEYHVTLTLTPATIWTGVPDVVRSEISTAAS